MWKTSLRPRRHHRVLDLVSSSSPTASVIRRQRPCHSRLFHASTRRAVVRPFILSDPGEAREQIAKKLKRGEESTGIKEVQIIQWFVEAGARVEQFDKIVEVQTDKASNEITSRYDGVIKKLHYETDDVVQVGQALLDIDVQSESAGEEEKDTKSESTPEQQQQQQQQPQLEPSEPPPQTQSEEAIALSNAENTTTSPAGTPPDSRRRPPPPSDQHKALATPAVRGLLKELDVDIRDVTGTGRDGRVTKEDVHAYAQARQHRTSTPTPAPQSQPSMPPPSPPPPSPRPSPIQEEPQTETPIPLTPVQAQMYKTMTKSLTIPHFLYADEVDVTALSALRTALNRQKPTPTSNNEETITPKLSYLPFILKAVSIALTDFPLINARLEPPPSPSPSTSQPRLLHRSAHNIGIAMDTPLGLLVPVIRNVQSHSIRSLAQQTAYLQSRARNNRLTTRDLTGGTFTVSNIGSLGGGTYVAPVIVPTEVAIVGAGRVRAVPRFANPDLDPAESGGDEKVVKRLIMPLSWSADHRVLDGATMARMAERVKMLLEQPGLMMVGMR